MADTFIVHRLAVLYLSACKFNYYSKSNSIKMEKSKSILVAAGITVLALLVSISSCKKDANNNSLPNLNINYPAAFVVNGGSNSLSVIKLSDGSVTQTIDLTKQPMEGMDPMTTGITWPHHIYVNSSKTQLAIGVPGMDLSGGHSGGMSGMSGKFVVLDAMKGYITKVVDIPAMNHNAIFSPNGTEIWTARMEEMGKVLVYDASTYQLKNTINVGMHPAEVTFSYDGSMMFVANGGDSSVTAINANDKTVMATIPVGADPVGAWPGSDNKMYVDNEEGQTISVIDVATMSVIETVALGFMPGMAAYNGGMNELWVTDPDNGKVHWWTWDAGMNMYMHGGEFATGAGAHAIAFNGMTAYITNQTAGTVSACDVMSHTVIRTISVGTKPNGICIKL